MPYKCVHCSQVYEDGSKEILSGCASCHGKFFFYIKKEKFEELKKNPALGIELDSFEQVQIERDVRDIAGIKDEEMPIFLDFESIRIVKPGKYLLDIGKLMDKSGPKIYQLEDGKYIVDLGIAKKEAGTIQE